jgi:hypothetical protein
VIINRNHVLIRLPPSRRRIEFSEATGAGLRKGGGVDAKVRELTLLFAIACLCLALAWAHEADYFAMFFAAVAAIAGVEAVRRSL